MTYTKNPGKLQGDAYVKARKKAPRIKVPNHPAPPKIEHSRPLPVQTRGGTRKFDHYYPLEDMKPGDSFWVPATSQCTAGAVSKFAKRTGWKFVSRGQTEEGISNKHVSGGRGCRGTRIWRVS